MIASAAEMYETPSDAAFPSAKDVCFASEANELFFGVVGHVGSGTGFVSDTLRILFEKKSYQAKVIKASDAIRAWALKTGQQEIPAQGNRSQIAKMERLQTLGDDMRKTSQDFAAVAQGVIALIRGQRAEWKGERQVIGGKPVQPEPGVKRAYIIDSIRHPAEVKLLRVVYGDAFALVGVVCEEGVRERRLIEKYFEWRERQTPDAAEQVRTLMQRDSDDKTNDYGQHVADAFWESDYFVDNTATRKEEKQEEFALNEDLGRFIDIITHAKIVRPNISETGMHAAVSAQIRSACLSRQVGASIVDQEGNVLAIGTNEVPKAGGGVYGESLDTDEEDRRCFRCENAHCSSNAEQNKLIEKLLIAFPGLREEGDDNLLIEKIRKVGLGSILEFTRAIHAEMDALTSAARRGISVKGAAMFVTTFPCHYCARHIVAAGIDQVQFIEPYPKSRALDLHGDSITNTAADWIAPSVSPSKEERNASKRSADGVDERACRTVGNALFGRDTNKYKVLFKPFVGVAPRLYHRAFTKDRKLKNGVTGEKRFGEPEWGGKWGIRMIPYTDLEARLTSEENE